MGNNRGEGSVDSGGMMRAFLRYFAVLLLFVPGWGAYAEKVADLPVPTHYVNDFAGVLSPDGARQIEDYCLAVQNQAHAQIAVVTIKTLDDGQSVEEFTAALEEKWKLGKKGEDRSALVLLVLNPHKLRVETGYGLEGILPDAKVGRILDMATPAAADGNYEQALMTVAQGLGSVVAADAGVTLQPVIHHYHRETAPQQIGMGQVALGIGAVILLLILMRTGHLGWAIYLLMSMMGGGGRGGGGGWGDGGGRGGDEGGGFGGVGGGESGGGGASRDF